MKLFRKIELTNYTLGSDKVEKWSFYYLLGWNFWKSKRIEIEETLIEREGKLYAGLEQLNNLHKEAIYDLNYNLVENNLEYKTAEQKRLRIKYTYMDSKNKKKSVEVGDKDGELRTFHTSIISDEKKMEEMAHAEMQKLKYDGFEGSVKSFLIPYASHGMTAVIKDKEHPNREGKYFIKKVVTSFGNNGARREISISNKL